MKITGSTIMALCLVFLLALATSGCARQGSDTMGDKSMETSMGTMNEEKMDDSMDKSMGTMNEEKMDDSMDKSMDTMKSDNMKSDKMNDNMNKEMRNGM